MTERREGTWRPWIATFPEGGDLPWAPPGDPPSGWDLVVRALGLALAAVRSARAAGERQALLPGVRLIPVDGDEAAFRAAEARLVPQPVGGAGRPRQGDRRPRRRPAPAHERVRAAESLVR